MIRDITYGQYYQADSVIHRLDPRVKLAGTLLFVISLFFPRSLFGMALASFCLLAVILLSQVPLRLIFKGVKPMLVIIIFSVLMNLFGTEGHIIWQAGIFAVSSEGVVRAVFLALRLIYLVAGSSLMTFTTTPWRLTDGLEQGLHFLTYLKVPVHEFALMMAIALKFIPILTEELNRIMDAQMSRGADFESGNILVRARKLIPLLVPLFVSAIRRASDLSMALEARGYSAGKRRTKLYPLCYGRIDYIAYGLIFIYMAAMAVLTFTSTGRWPIAL